MLGIRQETLSRRETGKLPINAEAELAMECLISRMEKHNGNC